MQNDHLRGATVVLLTNVFIFFCCDWSLNQWKNESQWVYLGLHHHATDTGSLAFNSAMLCRVAVTLSCQEPPPSHLPVRTAPPGQVMLSYNVDLLLLAPEFYRPLRDMGAQYHARMEAIGAAEVLIEIVAPEASESTPDAGMVGPIPRPHAIECRNLAFSAP